MHDRPDLPNRPFIAPYPALHHAAPLLACEGIPRQVLERNEAKKGRYRFQYS